MNQYIPVLVFQLVHDFLSSLSIVQSNQLYAQGQREQCTFLSKKNKKGNYIHFKIEANSETISELEKNEKTDKNLLRYLTIKVKKFDLDTDYFKKNEDKESEKKYKK